jgi:hypothetical protein
LEIVNLRNTNSLFKSVVPVKAFYNFAQVQHFLKQLKMLRLCIFCKLCTSTTPWKYKINKLWCLFEKTQKNWRLSRKKNIIFINVVTNLLMFWLLSKKTWFCWFSIGCQWLSNEFDWFLFFNDFLMILIIISFLWLSLN